MELQQIKLQDLKVSDVNPRFLMTEIAELAQSIKVHGILEPLIIEHGIDGAFTILAGHRRAAAAKKAGLAEVPCLVREQAADRSVLHLVENIQRVDLTPMETALAVASALETGVKQGQLAKQLGRSAAWVSKFATIAKAYAKKEQKKDGAGAYMVEITDQDKLYNEARKVLGLDKKDQQLEREPHAADRGDDETEDSGEESAELEVLRELRAIAGDYWTIEPAEKSGYKFSIVAKSEKAARIAAAFVKGLRV